MFKNLFFLIILLAGAVAHAQEPVKIIVSGSADGRVERLPGASIQWLHTQKGTVTDAGGEAVLEPFSLMPHAIVVSFVGYISDTIDVLADQSLVEVTLFAEQVLDEVEVLGRKADDFVSTLDPIKTEVINEGGFRKAACCNLSEAFQTNASVDISYSDAVTGAKEIQMLGLDGVYVQMLTEGVPTLRGLSGTFGLSHVPAPWMESISISKGATSVRNGHESITGAISIDYKKPFEVDKLYADVFLSHMGRTELNVVSGGKLNDKWSGMLFTNAGFFRTRMDRNDDTFIDDPLYQQYSAFNRWHYQNERAEAQIGARFLYEDREAGQIGHNNEMVHHPYKINIRSTHAEAFLKNGYFFPERPEQSVGYQVDGSWHRQEALYGAREYDGKQGSLFGNLIFQTVFKGNPNHGWVSGASGKYDRFRETFTGTGYDKDEWSAGIYAEYTYKYLEKITIVAGIRGDYHNLAEFQLTPKVHMRFVPWKDGTLRLSAGRGFRTVNIFAENTSLLASSRALVIEEELEPEIAWNTGVSIQQKFTLGTRESSIALDYYRTDFINQVIADVEGGDNTFRLYNLDGRSFSNSFQAELNMEAAPRFTVKAAYKLDDVRVTIDGNILQKPFLARHSGLLALSYETENGRWQFDTHTSLHGKHRLPASFEGSSSSFSPIYAMLNAQVTYRKKGWEVYLGGENITNYTQKDPIIGWQDPFGTNFDTAQAWGPIIGAMAYTGVRYTLK